MAQRCGALHDSLARCIREEGHDGEHRMRKPPGTTLRNVRIGDDLWRRAQEVASERDESVSDVLRAALERYVKRHG